LSLDYSNLGLKIGLEIHQQLKTKSKLFCQCEPKLSTRKPEITFARRLRPTQSELGQVDPAALFEFQKGRTIIYEADHDTACLVEMDEEPPHPINEEAIDISLTVALMIGANPVDEIHVMRKIVIDGSNTTGFQRTCVIALGGEIQVESGSIPIQTICLEEDAARNTGEKELTTFYRLDRLGIPLIEIATSPVISSPSEAGSVAFAIGRILRATGKVKRGIGTIRQDVNISINGGALVEIKGVSKLELVSKVIEYEVQRQLNLLKIRDELRRRGIEKEAVKEDFVDVTHIFKGSNCKVLRMAIDQKGVVYAVKLPKFNGLLKIELVPGVRLGTEMADRAKFWGGVGGIFHTDELPAYGISASEVDALKRALASSSEDAIVIVAGRLENARDALKAVVERAREAIDGVPSETRGPNPDGTTRYTRPRPGPARMYPETDIPPVPITRDRLERIRASLPEMPDQKIARLINQYRLNKKLAEQLVNSDFALLFEEIAQEVKVPTSVIAATLTETMKSLERDGIEVENLTDEQLKMTFKLVDQNLVAKESLPDILTWLAKHANSSPEQAIEALGLKMLSRSQLETIIAEILGKNPNLIQERSPNALASLMGIVMREVRGKADARVVNEILREKLGLIDKK
jgi:glutamyl-tRNA(Gln) amidotransferase subunit E